MKVLIADDSRAVRKMIALMVSELRPHVDGVLEAENADGVRAAGASAGRDLAVVVADWDLPGLSGAEIGAELRRVCGREVAVLVCLNPGQQADVANAGAAVRDFVVRPFTQDELRSKVLALLTKPPESAPPPGSSSRFPVAGLPFFLELPSAIMKDFLELATAVRHPAGTILMTAGRKVEALHVLSSGMAEVMNADGSAAEGIDEGDCFGEHAFLSGGTAPHSVRAKTKVEVVSLHRLKMGDLLLKHPKMSQYLRMLAARKPAPAAPSHPPEPEPAAPPPTPPPGPESSLEDLFGNPSPKP